MASGVLSAAITQSDRTGTLGSTITRKFYHTAVSVIGTVLWRSGLIAELRLAGARIKLISDGDVEAAIATCKPESGE